MFLLFHGSRLHCGRAEDSRGGRTTAEEEEVSVGISGADRKGRGGRGKRGRV